MHDPVPWMNLVYSLHQNLVIVIRRKGQQGQMSSSLDGTGQRPLMLGASARPAPRSDRSTPRYKLL